VKSLIVPAIHHERFVLTKRGKDVCAIVSIEDLKLLEALEDQIDIDMARQAIAEAGEERIPYQSLEKSWGCNSCRIASSPAGFGLTWPQA
jgi:hypothetical protein